MPTHGLASTYRNGCRCDPCTDAHTERCRDERAQRSQRPVSEIPHGESGYKNWDCRCEVCCAAGSLMNARRRSRRKVGA